ncbi:MAG TPA: Spx/MgsR family RNA polymerase-binding regulatory protein [Bdellovibrionota bacterium]|jgi:arsenate reductase
MKKLKVYEYGGCSTCKKALRFLDGKKIAYEKVDITEVPPSIFELKRMLGHVGNIGKLFNTSGLVYKELGLSKLLPGMSEQESLTLLAKNGRLVKRPFVLGDGWGAVGFKEEEWKKRL